MASENNPEEILAELMQAISDQDYVETLKLQKNAIVDGKTGSHPVDLYWEFADGGVTYKTLISLKTLNTSAVRSDVVKLADMVKDVFGLTTGVLFSQPVYDKDVKVLAANADISICEMMPPLPDTWNTIIDNFQIKPDEDFIKKEKSRLNITEQINVNCDNPKHLFLYNQNLECVNTIENIISLYTDKAVPANSGEQEINHTFTEETFLQTGHDLMPFVKIRGISFVLKFELITQMSAEDKVLEGNRMIEYILYNISKFIDFQ